MRRSTRDALVAVGAVAAVAVGAVTWYAARAGADPGHDAAAAASSPASHTASAASPTDTLSPSDSPLAIPTTAKATATTKVSPHAAPTSPSTVRPTVRPRPTPSTFHFPVPVSVGDAHQVITVSASGSYANVVAWQWSGGAWKAVIQTKSARIGANGLVAATQRVQGSNTTPAGTFTMTESFGVAANPGTKMAYHQVTSDDWWVEDNNSAYYNSMRKASQGGFAVTTSGVNGSEHLITFTTQYRYAVVINFNRPPNAVRHRGAGIFLHVNGTGATAGCVSVPLATMTAIMTWLDPAQHPRIAIG